MQPAAYIFPRTCHLSLVWQAQCSQPTVPMPNLWPLILTSLPMPMPAMRALGPILTNQPAAHIPCNLFHPSPLPSSPIPMKDSVWVQSCRICNAKQTTCPIHSTIRVPAALDPHLSPAHKGNTAGICVCVLAVAAWCYQVQLATPVPSLSSYSHLFLF